MKEIVKEYPDEPDLLAALGDSGVKLVNSYIQNGMAERAKPIAMDTERLAEKINKNPQLEKQVARFLKVGYGL